jgi:DNA-binding response OmpR family regulator
MVDVVLRTAGFEVLDADDGDVVVRLVQAQQPRVVLLDLRMARVSGMDALRALRAAGHDVPVIVLTGVLDEERVLDAFEAGADDYITKPFAPRVLLARVRAVLRRAHADTIPMAPDDIGQVGKVTLDERSRSACLGDKHVPLSPTEYHLLRTLMRSAGQVFTTAELLAQVWGPAYAGQDEIVRANVYRLRLKLEPIPSEPRYIRGRRGLGYFFTGTVS